MADTSAPHETSAPELKHLAYFRVAVIRTVAYLTTLYNHAKINSSSLRPAIDSIEGVVLTVVRPVLNKIKPDEILKFTDVKVDSILTFADDHVPDSVKTLYSSSADIVKGLPETVSTLYSDLSNKGITATGQELYAKSIPLASEVTHFFWKRVLALPLVPQFVYVSYGPAFYFFERYNDFLSSLRGSVWPVSFFSGFLPSVPVEAIESVVTKDVHAALNIPVPQ